MFHLLTVLCVLLLSANAYDVSTLSSEYKQTICANQVGYCTSICGGKDNTKFNACNQATMKWECQCIDAAKAPAANAATSLFPVNTYQCFGEKQECFKNCTTSPVAAGSSVDLCQYNQC